ncbi:hypothetical protein VTK73DRAFT_2300 [Phialemonium thermophilum]|uniref:Uncharacterized protein n=1 Tax=Phialemonium thermophilum TaxID=223376 RepID=A0ABR3VSB7_9PEZI
MARPLPEPDTARTKGLRADVVSKCMLHDAGSKADPIHIRSDVYENEGLPTTGPGKGTSWAKMDSGAKSPREGQDMEGKRRFRGFADVRVVVRPPAFGRASSARGPETDLRLVRCARRAFSFRPLGSRQHSSTPELHLSSPTLPGPPARRDRLIIHYGQGSPVQGL